MKNVAWAVTGAGHYLAESVAAMREISRDNRVSTFVSRAGEEVVRMYGLFDQLSEISGGEYLEEVFLEREEGASSPNAGRFMMNRYHILIIAPATANTVAKIVCGIADSLPTNAAALANKAGVPVYVLPTDVRDRAETEPPYTIDRDLCRRCEVCEPWQACPKGAIEEQIDLSKCDGCGLCRDLCPYGAIGKVEITVVTRPLDRENIERMRAIPGFFVLEGPEEIETLV